MLARQRQQRILDEVARSGAVKIADLVEDLAVSDMTLRRDIAELASKGLVERVHGGAAQARMASVHEPAFATKATQQVAAKQAIAKAAAQLVAPGSSLGMSAGTTTHLVATELLDIPDLTVVTNSLPVSDELHTNRRLEQTVLLTGGARTPSDALGGPMAASALQGFHLDLLILGVHGMAVPAGLTCPNQLETQANQAFIAASRQIMVVADHTKWGVVGLQTIAELTEVDVLITDDGLAAGARHELESLVGELIVVRA
ncbi:DeoR/GlpR family DNA-binding transcription regulator [Pseudonocardia spinosispora]|uniref:DeoR/GlpR family DNA-binding transcription regulator n=1 Tax=Pseudonocardia spinosispora TaxID=103441 RepID=UPI00048F0CBB|nr:DeoR/GlpR family DNA-binding transcription regulator [Pseudonocardia spinosispora]